MALMKHCCNRDCKKLIITIEITDTLYVLNSTQFISNESSAEMVLYLKPWLVLVSG